MPLVVTSAAGANGDGYGALLAFDDDGKPLGPFSQDSRIADPRGLAVNRRGGLLFINSATDRVLAIDRNGVVVRDSGPINGLNPGGGFYYHHCADLQITADPKLPPADKAWGLVGK